LNPGPWKPEDEYMAYDTPVSLLALLFLLENPIDRARVNLWTAFSKDITIEDGGRHVIPWGRWHTTMRPDVRAGLKEEKDGGTGTVIQFWNWCEEDTKSFATG
jgi:hypothetical protein